MPVLNHWHTLDAWDPMERNHRAEQYGAVSEDCGTAEANTAQCPLLQEGKRRIEHVSRILAFQRAAKTTGVHVAPLKAEKV